MQKHLQWSEFDSWFVFWWRMEIWYQLPLCEMKCVQETCTERQLVRTLVSWYCCYKWKMCPSPRELPCPHLSTTALQSDRQSSRVQQLGFMRYPFSSQVAESNLSSLPHLILRHIDFPSAASSLWAVCTRAFPQLDSPGCKIPINPPSVIIPSASVKWGKWLAQRGVW